WPVPVTGRRAKRGQRLRPFSAPTCNSMKVNAIDCDYTFGRGTPFFHYQPPGRIALIGQPSGKAQPFPPEGSDALLSALS
ncbi:MAG: hypothetical protein ACRD2P_04700, partial [Terriglobia bacterium]